MNQLFEAFLRNFYSIEQKEFKVRRENIKWQFSSDDKPSLQFLPLMQTDITLESETSKIIIDAKFYKETLKSNYGAEKVTSANLYQLFSYLINQRKEDTKTQTAAGILLYPTIETDYDLHFNYQSHKIFIKTVNLNSNWQNIEARLKTIISI
jgi:5-methylcytosine-specific restriction enzyme subunit McrC